MSTNKDGSRMVHSWLLMVVARCSHNSCALAQLKQMFHFQTCDHFTSKLMNLWLSFFFSDCFKIMPGKQNQFRSSIVIIKGVWNASGLQEKQLRQIQ